MKISRIIEYSLTIHNFADLYCNNNVDERLISILNQQLAGTCYDGCYVERVTKLVQRSDCNTSFAHNARIAMINVRVWVDAVVYVPGEIVSGARVIERTENNALICSFKYGAIFINDNNMLGTVTVGQIIPVRVGETRYMVRTNKIAINAFPLMFEKDLVAYKIVGAECAKLDFGPLMADMKADEDVIRDARIKVPKKCSIFERLLYAYKVKQTDDNAQIASLRDVVEGKVTGYIMRDARVPLHTQDVWVYDTKDKLPSGTKVNLLVESSAIIVSMIQQYRNYMQIILDMITTYNEAEATKHKNLWTIINKNKL